MTLVLHFRIMKAVKRSYESQHTHFTDEETKAQKAQSSFLKVIEWLVLELQLESKVINLASRTTSTLHTQ